MQPVSLLNMPQKYRINAVNAHDTSFGRRSHVDAEDRNSRILNRVREKEETAERGTTFYNMMQKDSYQRARSISEMNDEQLKMLSKALVARDDKYKFNTYSAALIGIPALDTIAKTAMTPGNLAGKMSTVGKTAGLWGGAFVLAALYNTAIDKVKAVSPVARKFGDDHPVLASLINLAGFGGVLIGAKKGLDLLISKSKIRFPNLAKHISEFTSGTALKVNQSKINTRFIQPTAQKITRAAAKYPLASGVLKSVAGLGAAAWAIGVIFKSIADRAENKYKTAEVYSELKGARQQNINALGHILAADKLQERFDKNVLAPARQEIEQAEIYKAVKAELAGAMDAQAQETEVLPGTFEAEDADDDDTTAQETGSRFNAEV